uniref:Capsid protein n=1 Tax=Angiostrongylus cantonensis TaxID=6313 RepID=A0A0K0D6Y0_ANGCA
MAMMRENCIIIRNTVTSICNAAAMAAGGRGNAMCMTGDGTNILPIPPTALTIGGTLTTTNIIMANWSREMWQSVLNRVVRTLASGPFGANFVSASGVVA